MTRVHRNRRVASNSSGYLLEVEQRKHGNTVEDYDHDRFVLCLIPTSKCDIPPGWLTPARHDQLLHAVGYSCIVFHESSSLRLICAANIAAIILIPFRSCVTHFRRNKKKVLMEN